MGFIIVMVHAHTLSPHSIAFRYVYYSTWVTILCRHHNRGDLKFPTSRWRRIRQQFPTFQTP